MLAEAFLILEREMGVEVQRGLISGGLVAPFFDSQCKNACAFQDMQSKANGSAFSNGFEISAECLAFANMQPYVFNRVVRIPLSREKTSVVFQIVLGDLTLCCFKMFLHCEWNDIGEAKFDVFQEL